MCRYHIRERTLLRELCVEVFGLADGHETCAESVGHGGSKEIAASFNTDYDIDGNSFIPGLQRVDGLTKAALVFEKRGDVVEIYSRLWPVFDFPNERL